MQPSDVKNLVEQFKQMRTMMKGLGGFGTKKHKSRSGKGKKGRNRGGRTTPKGPAKVQKTPLSLPGLETGDLPGLN